MPTCKLGSIPCRTSRRTKISDLAALPYILPATAQFLSRGCAVFLIPPHGKTGVRKVCRRPYFGRDRKNRRDGFEIGEYQHCATCPAPTSPVLDQGFAACDGHRDTGNVVRAATGQEGHQICGLFRFAHSAHGNAAGHIQLVLLWSLALDERALLEYFLYHLGIDIARADRRYRNPILCIFQSQYLCQRIDTCLGDRIHTVC